MLLLMILMVEEKKRSRRAQNAGEAPKRAVSSDRDLVHNVFSGRRQPHHRKALDCFNSPPIQHHHDESQEVTGLGSIHFQHLQQSLCAINQEWQSPEDCPRAVPSAGHPLLVEAMHELLVECPERCWRKRSVITIVVVPVTDLQNSTALCAF